MHMDRESDAAAIVADEGNAFVARHPDMPGSAASLGALTWGLMRALYASPCCPGRTLNPAAGRRDWWQCPGCHLWYEWRDEPEPPTKPKRRATRHTPASSPE